MPRQSRIDPLGALHHIIIRGIERRVIFRGDEDRESFLDRLGGILLESATPCYSWSLLDNHGHFLFRTGKVRVDERILKEADEDWEWKSLLRQRGIDMQQLVERIGGHFGPEIEDLKSGSKVSSIAKARAVLCYVGARQLGLPSVSIAEELGVSPSGVSRAILRGQKLLGQKDIEAILSESQ